MEAGEERNRRGSGEGVSQVREDLHRGPREWVCAHPQPVQRIQPDSLEEIDVSIVPVGKPCPKCHAEYGDSLELANMRRALSLIHI